MKFRKRPIMVEAMQWDGTPERLSKLRLFMGTAMGEPRRGSCIHRLRVDDRIRVHTLEGTMAASVGDWIIKGIEAEFYPCKPEIFEATYERVTTHDEEVERIKDQAKQYELDEMLDTY